MESHALLKMCLASQAHLHDNNIMLELLKRVDLFYLKIKNFPPSCHNSPWHISPFGFRKINSQGVPQCNMLDHLKYRQQTIFPESPSYQL